MSVWICTKCKEEWRTSNEDAPSGLDVCQRTWGSDRTGKAVSSELAVCGGQLVKRQPK